ncbi:MAG: motility protein A [Planctomycetes bacterium]|nr:motility protein A [Planctomycetota bacterium]
MDLATIIGIIIGVSFVAFGMLSDLPAFWDPPSVFVVLGGSFGAIVISLPLKDSLGMGKVLKHVFIWKTADPVALINQLVGFADLARRDGILALQSVTETIEDKFLVQGINLAVDGTDPDQILETMRTELRYLQERHESGAQIPNAFQKYSPAFGMIGTLIGLLLMLRSLDDPQSIGPAMSVALVTTFYGALVANLIMGPFTDKLKIRNKEEVLMKEIIIHGVMSIQSGDNPRIVKQKLAIFLAPALREEVLKDEK